MKKKGVGRVAKAVEEKMCHKKSNVGMHEGIGEPNLLYGSEVWVLNVHERKRIEEVEKNCLRNVCGVQRINRVRNEEIRRRCRKKASVGERIDQSILIHSLTLTSIFSTSSLDLFISDSVDPPHSTDISQAIHLYCFYSFSFMHI